MNLIIRNYIITTPIITIIRRLRAESSYQYFKDIQEKGEYIRVTCPFHKDGQESHPSCSIYSNYDSETIYPGTVHCFTCGKVCSLVELVSFCFRSSFEYAERWLIDNFGNIVSYNNFVLPEININKIDKYQYKDESEIEKYSYFHPYMFKRKLTEDVIRKFKIGYDESTNSITFPYRDEKGNLIDFLRRSVEGKDFYIPPIKNKPIYLLDTILKENITSVVVCESQINALVCWSWKIPAIALIGTGTKYQYNLLNNSGIRCYYLAFDGDDAGKKGTRRFIENVSGNVFINVIDIPTGKDVADLDKEVFLSLNQYDSFEWLNKF